MIDNPFEEAAQVEKPKAEEKANPIIKIEMKNGIKHTTIDATGKKKSAAPAKEKKPKSEGKKFSPWKKGGRGRPPRAYVERYGSPKGKK